MHRMKSLAEHLWFEVPGRRGFVNLTGTVESLVQKSGVASVWSTPCTSHHAFGGGNPHLVASISAFVAAALKMPFLALKMSCNANG
jgi:hypothetical protein